MRGCELALLQIRSATLLAAQQQRFGVACNPFDERIKMRNDRPKISLETVKKLLQLTEKKKVDMRRKQLFTPDGYLH